MNRDLISLIKSIHINPHNKRYHIHQFDKIVAEFKQNKLHADCHDIIEEKRQLRMFVRNSFCKDPTITK